MTYWAECSLVEPQCANPEQMCYSYTVLEIYDCGIVDHCIINLVEDSRYLVMKKIDNIKNPVLIII